MKVKRLFGLVILILILLLGGCKKDSPENVLNEFYQMVKSGKGAEAFLEYVDIEDFMTVMGFKYDPEVKESLENTKIKFLEIWTENEKKINKTFVKQLTDVKEFSVESKEKQGKDYILTVKTIYNDGTQKRESIYLKREKDTYKIVFSKLKEIDDVH